MPEDKNKLIDRIFTELDRNTDNVEKLSKIVYTQSSTLALLNKIVLLIITFLIITSLTILYNNVSNVKTKHEHEKVSQISKVLKIDYLTAEINKKGILKNVWKKLIYKNFI